MNCMAEYTFIELGQVPKVGKTSKTVDVTTQEVIPTASREPSINAVSSSDIDWPIVRSGPRPWVFWGPFWRPDRMVRSQNGSVSKIFFRPDRSVQSNLYRKMGTIGRAHV